MKLFGVFLLFVFLYSGCVKDTNKAVLTVNNTSQDLGVDVFINSEPVLFLKGFTFRNWKGLPLKSGKNELKLVVNDGNGNIEDFEVICSLHDESDVKTHHVFRYSDLIDRKYIVWSFDVPDELQIENLPVAEEQITLSCYDTISAVSEKLIKALYDNKQIKKMLLSNFPETVDLVRVSKEYESVSKVSGNEYTVIKAGKSGDALIAFRDANSSASFRLDCLTFREENDDLFLYWGSDGIESWFKINISK